MDTKFAQQRQAWTPWTLLLDLCRLAGPVQIAQLCHLEPSRVQETQHLGPLSSKHEFLT